MKLLLKALCWVTIPTTSVTLVLLALTIKAPVQVKTIAEQLNQNFHWGIWTDILSIQSVCILILAVMIPILLLTIIGLRASNSKLSKDIVASQKAAQEASIAIKEQLNRFSELLGPTLRKTGSMEQDDLVYGTSHLMGKLEELNASRTTSEAANATKLAVIKDDLDLASEMLTEITKGDDVRKTALRELINKKNDLFASIEELSANDHSRSVEDVDEEVKALTKKLDDLRDLDKRITEMVTIITASQASATAYADEKTGIDAKIAEAEKLVEAIQETLNEIEEEDFSQTEDEVSNIENDSSALEDRVHELAELMERLKTAKEGLGRTLAELQSILGVQTPTATGS